MRHDMILNVDIPDRVAVSYRLPINDSAWLNSIIDLHF
jgi:hypothetical protein